MHTWPCKRTLVKMSAAQQGICVRTLTHSISIEIER